jgi:hypothetical protein
MFPSGQGEVWPDISVALAASLVASALIAVTAGFHLARAAGGVSLNSRSP